MKKRKFSKVIALVLAMVLTVTANCTAVYAQTPINTYGESDPFELPPLGYYAHQDELTRYGFTEGRLSFTVLKDKAKVRDGASEISTTLYELDAGTEIIVNGAATNSHGNTWFALENGGYIYSRNVAFNLEENTRTEYLTIMQLREYRDDPEVSLLEQGELLLGLFTDGSEYFMNILGPYGYDTEYVIVTDRNCLLISPESMKYIFYGYLSGRLGFSKAMTIFAGSHAASVDRLQTNALESIDRLTQDTAFNAVSPLMGGWVQIAYDAISAYHTVKGAESDLEFVNRCKQKLCISDQAENLITIGYDLGAMDSGYPLICD